MKAKILFFGLAVLISYTTAWAQPTSYGNLIQGNAGNGGAYTNSYFGYQAGLNNAGNWNTFIGFQSGINNTAGASNAFLGFRAGLANTTGNANTFIGTSSGNANTSGVNNVFLGTTSGIASTTGNANTFIGYGSGYNNITGSNNVFLGALAGYNETGSNRLYIDNSATATPLIWGDFANNILNFNGDVGIGTANPTHKLHIVNNGAAAAVRLQQSGGQATDFFSANGDAGIFSYGTKPIVFSTTGVARMHITGNNGNVGIGTAAPDAKLAVNGDIHTREVRVDLNGAVAPDYVFEPDYSLRTLTEIETYIKANKHLPEIPSAAEMEENGINLKEMNLKLLQKIEELTLYVIALDKKIVKLAAENEALQATNSIKE